MVARSEQLPLFQDRYCAIIPEPITQEEPAPEPIIEEIPQPEEQGFFSTITGAVIGAGSMKSIMPIALVSLLTITAFLFVRQRRRKSRMCFKTGYYK